MTAPTRSQSIDDHVRRLVDTAPPLSAAQLAHLSALLHPATHPPAGPSTPPPPSGPKPNERRRAS